MRRLTTFLRYELKLQSRSVRFRTAAVLYLGLACAPPVILFVSRHRLIEHMGPSSYLLTLISCLPFLTVLLAVAVAGARAGGDAWPHLWSVLSAAEMSSAGYLLRRWLAIEALLIPLTVLPMLITAWLAQVATGRAPDALAWGVRWAVEVLPVALVIGALWLALVTIFGSELVALVIGVVGLVLGISGVNFLLFPSQLKIAGLGDVLGLDRLGYWAATDLRTILFLDRDFAPTDYVATEAPLDATALLNWAAPRWGIGFGLASALLGLAALFVHRSQRDLRPHRTRPDHPLRTLLPKLHKLRESLTPAAATERADRALAILGILGLALSLAVWKTRAERYRDLSETRYLAETTKVPAPMSTDLVALRWQVQGTLREHGNVATSMRATFEQRGPGQAEGKATHLAFTLADGLEIEQLEVERLKGDQLETDTESQGPQPLVAERSWDRITASLEPPLAHGEMLILTAALRGTPRHVDFSLPTYGDDSFASSFERQQEARYPRELSNVGLTTVQRAASPRRVELRAEDLALVPRYTTWELTEAIDGSRSEGGRTAPAEISTERAEIEVDLQLPEGWRLADACGTASSDGQLLGACRLPIHLWRTIGGHLEEVPVEDPRVRLLALPGHTELIAQHREVLTSIAQLGDRAWPGLEPASRFALVEDSPAFEIDLGAGMNSRWTDRDALYGGLLVMREARLLSERPLRAEDVVAELLADEILELRPIVEQQKFFFRQLYGALMVRRMGLAGEKGATLSGPPWMQQSLRQPILEADYYHFVMWRVRLPALVADLEGRLGATQLFAGIQDFLDAGTEPCGLRDLFTHLEQRSGQDLTRAYNELFAGPGVPELELENIVSRRTSDSWTVEGVLRNRGTGEVFCPVIVRTELDEGRQMVRVGTDEASPISITVDALPHAVLLDPQNTCLRWKGRNEQVDLAGH